MPTKPLQRKARDTSRRLWDAVQRLTAEVQRLRKRVADLKKDRQVTTIQTSSLKRNNAEALQMRLIDIKKGNLQRILSR